MALEDLGRYAAIGGRSLAKGAAGLGDIASLAYNIGPMAGRYVGEKLRGSPVPEEIKGLAPYPSERLGDLIDKLSKGYTKPKNFGERAFATGVEFAGGGGIGSGLAKAAGKAIPKILPQTGREVAALGAAGIGSQAGQEAFPEHPVAGALGGALLGGRVGNAALLPQEGKFLKEHAKSARAVPQEQAGELLQQGAKKYRTAAGKESSKLYGEANTLLDENANIPMRKTETAIGKLLSGKTNEQEKILRESTSGKLISRIQKDILMHDGELPYETVKLYKDEISDLITTHGQLGGKEQGRIKHIASILDDEVKSTLQTNNPKGYKALEKANKFYGELNERDKDIFNSLIGEESGTKAFQKTLGDAKRVDAKRMEVAMKHLDPLERETVSASFVQELGKDAQNVFSLKDLQKNFKGLEPNAQDIVLSGLPKESGVKLKKLLLSKDELNPVATSALSALFGGSVFGPIGAVLGVANPKVFPVAKVIDAVSRAGKIRSIDAGRTVLNKSLMDIRAVHPESAEMLDIAIDAMENPESDSAVVDDVAGFQSFLNEGNERSSEESEPIQERNDVSGFQEFLRNNG